MNKRAQATIDSLLSGATEMLRDDVEKAFKALGFQCRPGKGSHIKWWHPDFNCKVIWNRVQKKTDMMWGYQLNDAKKAINKAMELRRQKGEDIVAEVITVKQEQPLPAGIEVTKIEKLPPAELRDPRIGKQMHKNHTYNAITKSGEWLRDLRVKLQMTQKDFAELCNISQGTVAQIESGRTSLTARAAERIGLACDIPRDVWEKYVEPRRVNKEPELIALPPEPKVIVRPAEKILMNVQGSELAKFLKNFRAEKDLSRQVLASQIQLSPMVLGYFEEDSVLSKDYVGSYYKMAIWFDREHGIDIRRLKKPFQLPDKIPSMYERQQQKKTIDEPPIIKPKKIEPQQLPSPEPTPKAPVAISLDDLTDEQLEKELQRRKTQRENARKYTRKLAMLNASIESLTLERDKVLKLMGKL